MSNKLMTWTRAAAPLVALGLAACGTSEGTTRQAEVPAERAQLRVVLQEDRRNLPDPCGNQETMRLVVLDGSRQLLAHDYCSAYNLGSARLVTDARGEHFILLEHGEGRGTRATTMFLTIYELDLDLYELGLDNRGILEERARLMISETVGLYSDSTYRYDVATPARGGIRLTGDWTMAREHMRPDELRIAPVRNRMVLEIDNSPSPAG